MTIWNGHSRVIVEQVQWFGDLLAPRVHHGRALALPRFALNTPSLGVGLGARTSSSREVDGSLEMGANLAGTVLPSARSASSML